MVHPHTATGPWSFSGSCHLSCKSCQSRSLWREVIEINFFSKTSFFLTVRDLVPHSYKRKDQSGFTYFLSCLDWMCTAEKFWPE